MSNNCLVTKLKGTVQNNNLPELNTIYLNLKDTSFRYSSTCSLLLGIKQGKTIKITSLYPFHPNVSTTAGVTEYTMTATGTYHIIVFMFNAEELPSNAVENCVKITGDIYDIIALAAYPLGRWFDFNKTTKNSLASLDYADSLICKTVLTDKVITNLLQVVIIDDFPILSYTDYSDIIPNNNNIKWITSLNTLNGAPQVVGVETLRKLTHVKDLALRVGGSINEVPLSVDNLMSPSSSITGTLEDFVADRRTKGKIEGYLAFASPDTVWTVTYGGTPLKDLPTDVRPIISNKAFLVWDAYSMSWANQKPEGFTSFSSPYWATKAILDGEL